MSKYVIALCFIVAVGLTVLSGVIHGRMSGRWGPPQVSLVAAERLSEIPERLGDWQLGSTQKMGEAVIATLECTGYVIRTYVNQTSGATVDVMVIVGPPGPTSVHTPEICFPSRAHKALDTAQPVSIAHSDGPDHTFWAMTFQEASLSGNWERVYYAWTTGNRWIAAEHPRTAFASNPYLYKIQIMSRVAPGTDFETTDPCREFLESFVQDARPYLIAPSRS